MKIHHCDLQPGHVSCCQICQSSNLQQVTNLGFSAPCDSLLTEQQLQQSEKTYPLNLVRCRDCGLVQIDFAVDAAELFHPEYPYRSGITDVLKKNLHAASAHICQKMNIPDTELAVDIGSNDGTYLEGFKNLGMRVIGVEPTKISEIANANGIPTINSFFSHDIAKQIVDEHGKASVITAANVFAHVNMLSSLLNGVYELLTDDGVFVTESHYMVDILETLQYDSVYHEHLRFYLIKPLARLFDDHGFSLVDVERIPNYGGSIRVYAKKGKGLPMSDATRELIAMEEQMGCYEDSTYDEFAERVLKSRKEIQTTLARLLDEGKTVAGIGCPGRAITLLSCCGINTLTLPYIAEQPTSLKLGMFTPGTHIPVVDEARMLQEQPDYGFILSWHYADAIIANMRKKGLKSKIIVPLPEIRIVD